MNFDPRFYQSQEWQNIQRRMSNADPSAHLTDDQINNYYNQWKANLDQETLQGKVDARYNEVTDFNSPLYQNFRSYAQKSTPGIGVNSLIAPLKAGGLSTTGAKNIASSRMQELQTGRNEQISNAVTQFALGQQGQATGLLGLFSNNQNNYNQLQLQYAQLGEQQRQFNESQPTFFDSLLNIVGGIAGQGTGNLMSGKSFFGGGNGNNYYQGNVSNGQRGFSGTVNNPYGG